MNADKNKLFSYRRSSAFIGGSIFFALPPRDSVLTGARPGRSEKVAQSDSSAAPIHEVDLGGLSLVSAHADKSVCATSRQSPAAAGGGQTYDSRPICVSR